MRRRADPVRRVLLLSLLTMLAGCLTPPAEEPSSALPVVVIVPDLRVELSVPGQGLASRVRVGVRLAGDGRAGLVVRPARPADAGGQGAALELHLRWEDYPGTRPVTSGRQAQKLVPWTERSWSSPDAPLTVFAEVPLEPVSGLLARRVIVWGRLIGVEFVGVEGRSGGTVLELPLATIESFAVPPAGSLTLQLESGNAPGIFLLAVTAPVERRSEVLDTLIEALPGTGRDARNAAFAALLYLTGETHGYDIHRWRIWWAEHTQMQVAP